MDQKKSEVPLPFHTVLASFAGITLLLGKRGLPFCFVLSPVPALLPVS